MKAIYYSKRMVTIVFFVSLALVLNGAIEENLTYKILFLFCGFIFLLFSLCALKFPAIKIEGTFILIRQYFGFSFRTIDMSDFVFYEQVGKSRLNIYDKYKKKVLKLGFFNENDLEEILKLLKLKPYGYKSESL